MCGISGFFNIASPFHNREAAEASLANMTDALRHRGPDGHGLWLDADSGIAMGHRRLSIVDHSPAGAQPMHSHCGRYVLSYNGEIYNCRGLGQAIEARTGSQPAWRGHSDSEVFLEACAAFGVRGAVEQSMGMFAFALWDKHERVLTLGRDRFGVKPLFWTRQNNTVLFASEMKALRRHPYFRPDISRDALAAYFRCNHFPAPLTIYEGVHQLRPGHLLTVNGADMKETPWWSSLDVALAGVKNRITCHKDTLDELHALLRDAVQRHMAADVAAGAFLSGGIDSSLVVALMQEASMERINTFSIGFEEAEFNEAPYAKAIAESLGTRHTELYVSAQDAVELVPKLPGIYNELHADSSQIPTTLLSELTRASCTVALSGDGGDELFGGYGHYGKTLPPRERPSAISRAMFYQRRQFGRWFGRNVVPGGKPPPATYVKGVEDRMFSDEAELRQYIDTMHYLPGVLTKVERASMAASLEVRPPLLDHRIYALAWRMPPDLRRANGKGKWPLRHILDRYVSPVLTERPKQGFGIPLLRWLRGPLREWAEALLAPDRLQREGWLNSAAVSQMWKDTLAEKQYVEQIWAALMFQAWLEAQSAARQD